MAATIGKAGYFSNIDSLELTPGQQQEFDKYSPLVKKIACGFATNDALISVDDMAQMALVKMVKAIKAGCTEKYRSKTAFYIRLIQMDCMCRIKNNKGRYEPLVRLIDTKDSAFLVDDVDRLNAKVDVDKLLSSVDDKQAVEIMHRYYGIDTRPATLRCISTMIGKHERSVSRTYKSTLRRLQCQTE